MNLSPAPRFLYLQLHLLVALFASTAVFGHLLTLSAPALVMWRTFFAAIGAAVVAVFVFRQKYLFFEAIHYQSKQRNE